MNSIIHDRVLKMADMLLNEQSTVREVAKKIGYSKSTVHKDLTLKLPQIDYDLFLNVKKLLDYNKMIRHIRGGESTKIKYQAKKLPHESEW